MLFWDLGKSYFNPVNAVMMTVLVMEIYWLSHEGKITFSFNPSYLFWIFFCLWAFNGSFIDTCLWMSGSSNYLWMIVVVLAFLIPYVRNYYDEKYLQKDTLRLNAGMFLIGTLAGWSNETTICWLILVLFYWLYVCKKKNCLRNWKTFGFLGLCTGYLLLICAPGNFYRLSQQQGLNGGIPISELYIHKFTEVVWIMLFHFFLIYFIVRFFLREKRRFKNKPEIKRYLSVAKIFSFIAIGSGIVMFMIPVSGWRPSFLSLVFLVAAVATLFRGQDIANKFVFNKQEKGFLKLIGCSYFIMTVFVSLLCNYTNWNHWNDILSLIYMEQKQPSNLVLNVKPYYTDDKAWLHFCSGLHLIYMPVVYGNENNRINATVARYYNIKGVAKFDR